MQSGTKRDPASFRDPAAKVYTSDGMIMREIYPDYFREYNHFMKHIYPELVKQELIIKHQELYSDKNRLVISPETIPFISYPYEWSFRLLKEAALVTLIINRIAMQHGMMLKDASAYNIQYHEGRMKLIDTCSFMFYDGNTPWGAYSQFLRHFVSPLVLIKHIHPHEAKLSQIYLDGVPVPYASNRIPLHTRLYPSYWVHIFTQSWADLFKSDRVLPPRMSEYQLTALLDNLWKFVVSLKYKPLLPEGWLKYAEAGSYTFDSLMNKKDIVRTCIKQVNGETFLDLGTNTGCYSEMAADYGKRVIAVDSDHDCIHSMHREADILPLVLDICNPSPGIGWANRERKPFWDRVGEVDCIMALALIHHLSIRNNVPLGMVADLMAEHARNLIIEWVPPDDKQAQKLLGIKNIPPYSLDIFKAEFTQRYRIIRECKITGSKRIIYFMERLWN